MVSSARSFASPSSVRASSLSEGASRPRGRVPLIGVVRSQAPLTSSASSGLAAQTQTGPRSAKNPYGAGDAA